jgi:hypothetical protein
MFPLEKGDLVDPQNRVSASEMFRKSKRLMDLVSQSADRTEF